jgi:hypothetical protein
MLLKSSSIDVGRCTLPAGKNNSELGILVNRGFVMSKEPRGKGDLGSDVVKHTSSTTCKKDVSGKKKPHLAAQYHQTNLVCLSEITKDY